MSKWHALTRQDVCRVSELDLKTVWTWGQVLRKQAAKMRLSRMLSWHCSNDQVMKSPTQRCPSHHACLSTGQCAAIRPWQTCI